MIKKDIANFRRFRYPINSEVKQSHLSPVKRLVSNTSELLAFAYALNINWFGKFHGYVMCLLLLVFGIFSAVYINGKFEIFSGH